MVDCHEDRPQGCDENEVFNITTYGKSPEIKIPSLRKYTKYNLQVQVFNSKGRGGFSTTINITTDEDSRLILFHFCEKFMHASLFFHTCMHYLMS